MNNAETAADTSSAPAAATAVVGNAAAALAWTITEPTLDNSAAAAWTNSGATNTNDIGILHCVLVGRPDDLGGAK
ncbi:hypothetical protein MSHI_05030 [Mycobacterium shinjukuense]|uniref:Uncharacterized protein n=1 Tax=Mycobacterium shinjukuense TaxID=398694 RepID=A0A7I7MLD9_9MYCO|nr:hypothetical protein MSHI_05030 [Mycobacterium shinjukuense]